MSADARTTPVELGRSGADDIVVTWADGAETVLAGELLRARCPCAQCVEEWTGRVMIRPDQARGVGVRRMEQVGDYAFSITFSDGHATGIFTYARLRDLADAAG